MPHTARLQRLSNGRTYLNATAAGLSWQSEWLEMSLSSASCMGGIDCSRADIGHQAAGCYKDAPTKQTLANGRNGSEAAVPIHKILRRCIFSPDCFDDFPIRIEKIDLGRAVGGHLHLDALVAASVH